MEILRRFHQRLKCQTGALKMLNWKTGMMLKKQLGCPMPKVFPAIRKNHLYQILISSEWPFVKVDWYFKVICINYYLSVPHIIRDVQEKCSRWIGCSPNKFGGAQPVSMTRENLCFLSDKKYRVSWKADGTRYMMCILGKDQIYMVDRDNTVFKISNLTFPRRKDPNSHLTDVLLDGEMVLDIHNGNKYPRFLVYDIVQFQTDTVGKVNFDIRLTCIKKEIIGPRQKIDKSRIVF